MKTEKEQNNSFGFESKLIFLMTYSPKWIATKFVAISSVSNCLQETIIELVRLTCSFDTLIKIYLVFTCLMYIISRRFRTGFKIIILDEADAMTKDAQNALRRIVEKYTENVRYIHAIQPAAAAAAEDTCCIQWYIFLCDLTSLSMLQLGKIQCVDR